MPDADLISFRSARAAFLHPFKTALLGDTGATIRPGLVNTMPATIGGIPLAGDDDNDPPQLTFDELDLDEEGRGYVAIETTHAAKDWSTEKVEVVQVAYLDRDDAGEPGSILLGGTPILKGRRSRHPLAMLRLRKSGRLDLFQICFFSLQVRVDIRPAGDGGRAFYWPT